MAHLRSTAAAYGDGLVPVVKGNGYGFGRPLLHDLLTGDLLARDTAGHGVRRHRARSARRARGLDTGGAHAHAHRSGRQPSGAHRGQHRSRACVGRVARQRDREAGQQHASLRRDPRRVGPAVGRGHGGRSATGGLRCAPPVGRQRHCAAGRDPSLAASSPTRCPPVGEPSRALIVRAAARCTPDATVPRAHRHRTVAWGASPRLPAPVGRRAAAAAGTSRRHRRLLPQPGAPRRHAGGHRRRLDARRCGAPTVAVGAAPLRRRRHRQPVPLRPPSAAVAGASTHAHQPGSRAQRPCPRVGDRVDVQRPLISTVSDELEWT